MQAMWPNIDGCFPPPFLLAAPWHPDRTLEGPQKLPATGLGEGGTVQGGPGITEEATGEQVAVPFITAATVVADHVLYNNLLV